VRDVSVALQVLADSSPVKVPTRDAEEFFRYLTSFCLENTDPMRIFYDAFGAPTTEKFISIFKGRTVRVQSRSFWEKKYREAHVLQVLSKIAEPENLKQWNFAVRRLASHYGVPAKSIVQTYQGALARLASK
jgi:hypothetical protein